MPKLFTRNGYDFYACASLLQKSLRRGDVVLAARAVNELCPKYVNYVWNRLFVVSAEDCAGLVTGEVMALYLAWCKVNEGQPRDDSKQGANPGLGWMKPGSRMFFMKAVVLLAKCKHSRDADELALLVSDRLPEEDFEAALRECAAVLERPDDADWEMPDWVFDLHTSKGKRRGMTKKMFLEDEHDALVNSTSIISNFDALLEAWGYVEPEFEWD